VLQTEIEAQSAAMALEQAKLDREALWRRLSAAAGDVSLPLQTLAGDLEKLPLLEQQAAIERILAESPEIDHAAAEVARAEARMAREKVEIVPDIKAEGGFRYNPATFIRGQPIGREGFFQVGVEIPLFDRNRGGVAEAKADLQHAQADVELVKLSLHDRLAVAYGQYAASAALAARYRDEMLPRAREAYQLYLDGFRRMAAAYPQALIAKRSLVELERDYMRALNSAWQAAIAIDGLLLTDDGAR
jgi:cobalt-zinc-cadmium efflux system outer membrane protein